MQFTLHPGPAYLRVRLTGIPTAAEVSAMFQEMALQAPGSPPRALIELQVAQCLNILDTMKVMSALPQMGFPSRYRLALLITDEKMRESAQFAETVALNRGIAVRVFDDRQAAEHWLSV